MRLGHKNYVRLLRRGAAALAQFFDGQRVDARPRARPRGVRFRRRPPPSEPAETSAHLRHLLQEGLEAGRGPSSSRSACLPCSPARRRQQQAGPPNADPLGNATSGQAGNGDQTLRAAAGFVGADVPPPPAPDFVRSVRPRTRFPPIGQPEPLEVRVGEVTFAPLAERPSLARPRSPSQDSTRQVRQRMSFEPIAIIWNGAGD
eukprot:209139-Pyramimonas_sp.AAC.1